MKQAVKGDGKVSKQSKRKAYEKELRRLQAELSALEQFLAMRLERLRLTERL